MRVVPCCSLSHADSLFIHLAPPRRTTCRRYCARQRASALCLLVMLSSRHMTHASARRFAKSCGRRTGELETGRQNPQMKNALVGSYDDSVHEYESNCDWTLSPSVLSLFLSVVLFSNVSPSFLVLTLPWGWTAWRFSQTAVGRTMSFASFLRAWTLSGVPQQRSATGPGMVHLTRAERSFVSFSCLPFAAIAGRCIPLFQPPG